MSIVKNSWRGAYRFCYRAKWNLSGNHKTQKKVDWLGYFYTFYFVAAKLPGGTVYV